MEKRQDMQENKIAIIAQCGADGTSAMHAYAEALIVPEGYEAERIEIPHAESVAAAYQRAMEQSSAKYKVYLSAGSVIVKADFLVEMIRIFTADEMIGLIGAVGTDQLSASGIMARSPRIYGRLLYWDGSQFSGEQAADGVQDVMAVTGELIATQYDTDWRCDLFAHDCFWSEAQCAEFRRRGLRAVVPQQAEAWVLAAKNAPFHAPSREVFLDTYSKDIYPLVSVVIPTYRTEFFRQALLSVLAQTYRNLDIFVTDNAKDNGTEEMMARAFSDDARIRYEHHADYTPEENWARARAYDNPKAEYVNWLMDDDLFLPEKIETMIDYFLANPGISLVTSYRECIDENGNKRPDLPYTKPLVHRVTRICGEELGAYILRHCINVVGEPTTPLVRKAFLLSGHDLGWTGREGRYLISDFPTWLRLLAQGDAIYLPQPLSQFRMHEGNENWDPVVRCKGYVCMAMEIEEAIRRNVFLHTARERREAITVWLAIVSDFLQEAKCAEALGEWQDVQMLMQWVAAMAAAPQEDYRLQFGSGSAMARLIQQEAGT